MKKIEIVLKNKLLMLPHRSPEVSVHFSILYMYLMGPNGSSAYWSVSRGKLLYLIIFMQISLRLGLGLRLVLQLGLVSSYYNLASDLTFVR